MIGQLIRRLRAERRDLSLAQVTVLGRLDRGGPAGVSDLAAGERVRPQSMASTVAALLSGRPRVAGARRRPTGAGR